MAKEMIESRAILALVIPPNIFGFRDSLEKIEPGGKFLILGGGDVVFPIISSRGLSNKISVPAPLQVVAK